MNSSVDFFSLFDLPVSSEVNTDLLEHRYKQLQSQLHPDRHVNSEGGNKLAIIQKASMLNDAYATLKSPLRRAEHLLNLQDVNTSVYEQRDLDSEFLLAQLNRREELEDLQLHGQPEDFSELQAKVEKELADRWIAFSANYEAHDFRQAYLNFRELQFLYKLVDEIREAEDRLLDY